MLEVVMKINTDYPAFANTGGPELASILRRYADLVESWPGKGEFRMEVFDRDGNKVGFVEANELSPARI